MARGTMHPSKDASARRRRNAPTHDSTLLPRDGKVRGPEIAEATGRDDWSPGLLSWWKTWREAPQAAVFEATDWSRLALLAPIVEGYLRRPSAAALSEIRMNEERLGATVVDRMRARMTIEAADDEDGEDAPVVRLVSSREDAKARLQGRS